MTATLIATLLKLTVTGSVLVLMVLLFRFIFRGKLPKNLIVSLWLLAFSAFVIPVSLPAPAFFNSFYASTGTATVLPLPSVVQTQQKKVQRSTPAPTVAQSQKVQNSGQSETKTDPSLIAAAVYAGIGAAVLLVFVMLYVMTVRRFHKVLPVEDSELFHSFQHRLKIRRRVFLGLSGYTSVPVTTGIIRPKIVFPLGFDLNNKELTSHIYVHELIHVKKNDNAVSLLALFIACLHWFNPLAWIAYLLLCRDMELACDSGAVKILGYGNRAEYARSLLSMAGQKKRVQPMFIPAFGKNDIKERVTNVMNTKKLTARTFSLGTIAILITAVSFSLLSCKSSTKDVAAASGNSGPSSIMASTIPLTANTSSTVATPASNAPIAANMRAEKDITNAKYKKLFTNFVYNYYCENVGYDAGHNNAQPPYKCKNYSGKMTSANAEALIRCAIDQNQSGITLDKYTSAPNPTEQFKYEIPQAIGDNVIKSCFDVQTVDHSIFRCYDGKTKKYVIDGGDFGASSDWFAATVIKSIQQTGDKVAVTANFYKVKSTAKDGTPVPDYNKGLQSMKFTFKVSGDKYLYEKVETL